MSTCERGSKFWRIDQRVVDVGEDLNFQPTCDVVAVGRQPVGHHAERFAASNGSIIPVLERHLLDPTVSFLIAKVAGPLENASVPAATAPG